jgi:hypothetical protein
VPTTTIARELSSGGDSHSNTMDGGSLTIVG